MAVISSRSQNQSSNHYAREFAALRNRVQRAVQTLRQGGMIMVGDDGRRENEADLVFHASHATTEHVNFTLLYGRGLVCVSLSQEIADRLGFATAPKLPGGISHTGFTLSVDARNGISSGISAKDRAHSIRLMANASSSTHDFVSPGHVFPIRAMDGGLFVRAGHTEAVLDLCKLADMPAAAVMCEVLADDGEALRPDSFLNSIENESAQQQALRMLPYISTVDLLWYRVFYEGMKQESWEALNQYCVRESTQQPLEVYVNSQSVENKITLKSSVSFYQKDFSPEKLRFVLTNGSEQWDNGVTKKECAVEVVMFDFKNLLTPIRGQISEFCDLSAKEGIHHTQTAVKRAVTQLRAFEFIKQHYGLPAPVTEMLQGVELPVAEDKSFLLSLLTL